MQKLVRQHFQSAFGQAPRVWVKSPGRIALLGQRMAEGGGLALPFALDRHVELAAGPARMRAGNPVRDRHTLLSIDTDELAHIAMEDPVPPFPGHWSDPLAEVFSAFRRAEIDLPPIQAAFTGNLPDSASLAAPIALACALGLALRQIAGIHISRENLARLCGFRDAAAGIAVLRGKRGCALKVDTLTLDHSLTPMRLSPYSLVFSFAPLSPEARGRPYGAEKRSTAGIGNPEDMAHYSAEENRRVQEADKALLAGDFHKLAMILQAATRTKAAFWPEGSPEAESLLEASRSEIGVLAASTVGEGGEAAVLSIVHRDDIDRFTASVRKGFRLRYGIEPGVLECETADGALVRSFS